MDLTLILNSMNNASIQANQLIVDGKPIQLLSGEVHYWRLQPYYWEKILQRVREMGIQIIASYICWEFHEYEIGKLDFTGETVSERNLVGFLELCQSMNFKVIIRPGPYIYSEWPQAGIPARLARCHRLHPVFLKESEHYIQQVTETLKPWFSTKGGPIILLQADNEIDSFAYFHGEQLGIYGGEGLFQEFLKEKYQTIEHLNRVWQTRFREFSETAATIKVKDQILGSKARALDFFQFQHWCAKKIARWVVNTYRAAGVDVPIYLNTVHHCYSQNLREMDEEFGLVGIDLYPSNEFHASDDEHLKLLRNVCYASAVTKLPYIPEFQCGIWHGYHYHTKNLTANHYRMSCLTALMGGIVGWNWYMLVERDNWYYSPINSRGFVRPELFEPMKKIAEVFHCINPAKLTRMTATAITEDEYHFWAEGNGPQNPMGKAVYESGIPFSSFDLIKGDPKCQLLLYAGPDWLPRTSHHRLRQFVEEGGTLVCCNIFPQLDETFQPYAALPFAAPDGSTFAKNFDLKLGTIRIRLKDSLSIFRQVPGEPIYAAQSERQVDNIYAEENALLDDHESGRKFTIGYQLPIGKGRLVYLGVAPTPEIVRAIHHMMSTPIYCQTNTPNALVTLFQKNERNFYVIVINLGTEARDVQVLLTPAIFANSTWDCSDLFADKKMKIAFSEIPVFSVLVARKDGTVLELSH